MSAPIPTGAKCPCGQDLPWHMFELGLGRFEHNCSCDRLYRQENGEVKLAGTKKNVFAEFDRTHEYDADARCPWTGGKGAWVKKRAT